MWFLVCLKPNFEKYHIMKYEWLCIASCNNVSISLSCTQQIYYKHDRYVVFKLSSLYRRFGVRLVFIIQSTSFRVKLTKFHLHYSLNAQLSTLGANGETLMGLKQELSRHNLTSHLHVIAKWAYHVVSPEVKSLRCRQNFPGDCRVSKWSVFVACIILCDSMTCLRGPKPQYFKHSNVCAILICATTSSGIGGSLCAYFVSNLAV